MAVEYLKCRPVCANAYLFPHNDLSHQVSYSSKLCFLELASWKPWPSFSYTTSLTASSAMKPFIFSLRKWHFAASSNMVAWFLESQNSAPAYLHCSKSLKRSQQDALLSSDTAYSCWYPDLSLAKYKVPLVPIVADQLQCRLQPGLH
jgi:hypothetical protein